MRFRLTATAALLAAMTICGCGLQDDRFLVAGFTVEGGGEPMEIACADLGPKLLARAIILTDQRCREGMSADEQMLIWADECGDAENVSDSCLPCAAEVVDYVYTVLHADN